MTIRKRIPSTSTEPFLIPLVDTATNRGTSRVRPIGILPSYLHARHILEHGRVTAIRCIAIVGIAVMLGSPLAPGAIARAWGYRGRGSGWGPYRARRRSLGFSDKKRGLTSGIQGQVGH